MKLSDRISGVILAVIIVLSLSVSTVFVSIKQGYHEDELLTYNLANSSKELNVDGGWNSPEDFDEYLTVDSGDRFDYAQVYNNQIIDASHPPFYYALVHTVCSFFPGTFSPYLAYSVNVLAMAGILFFLYKIAKRIAGDNFRALIATGAYALSIACFTTTFYLRMYATLTFFAAAFVYNMIRLYDKKGTVNVKDCLILVINVTLGVLTQYYFILFAGLAGIVFLVFKIKEKNIRDLVYVIVSAVVGAGIALAIYPYIISNVLGGNRGFGSLDIDVDTITIVTYVGYKLMTYINILAKELFLGQVWLLFLCTAAVITLWIYLRFRKKVKIPRRAMFIILPSTVYFAFISLVSPFNSDRYVMASLPFIAMIFAFAMIKAAGLVKNTKAVFVAPAVLLAASVIALVAVRPYYLYGKTNLYDIKDKNCLFVGTSMMEWNKCIDKLRNYDGVMIAQTSEMDPNLGDELDEFATKRGVITNGKISKFATAYMNNGSEKELKDSMDAIKADKRLAKLDSVTVYISRLADTDGVIEYIKENTKFKNCELIQADYDFEDFYNWYDYFAETESYCNVYRFY